MDLFREVKGNANRFFQDALVARKFNSFTGYLLIATFAILLGLLISAKMIAGVGVLALVIGVFIVGLCILNPEIGLYLNIFYAYIAFHWPRIVHNTTFPVGVLSDILVVATFLGIYIGKRGKKELPPSKVFNIFLILYCYYLLEVFNINARNFAGSVQNFRKVAAEFCLLFVSYNLFTSYEVVRRFIIAMFVTCTLAGIYGCLQQWHGLFGFELDWVMGDDLRFGLIFIDGNFRKFSSLSDPTAYGLIMAAASVFFTVLAINHKKTSIKIILLIGIVFMLLGMAYSGTRTANAMFVAGLFLFVLLTLNKGSTRIFAAIAVVGFIVLLYIPIYDNQTINRFRSTFSGEEDASYMVRVVNRAFIQPYIHSHPLGGGLGTSGVIGLKNAPGHPLAGFPTDSGYVKFATELGWIGLGLICISYFIILRNAISQYFAATNPHMKNLLAACCGFLFSFYVAQYAQDSLGQLSDIVFYFPIIAITLRADQLGEKLNSMSAL